MVRRASMAVFSSLPLRRMPAHFHINSLSWVSPFEAAGLGFAFSADFSEELFQFFGAGTPGRWPAFFFEPGASFIMAIPARAPKTRPSRRELLASRLAPCTPVAAVSPAAYKPDTEVLPQRSALTPPIVK